MKILSMSVIVLLVFGLNPNPVSYLHSGNEIYYSSESNSQGRDIYKMNSDGSNRKKLTQKRGNGHYPHNSNPKVSPDGSKIVYQSDPDGHDRYTIWTMNKDGSNQKKITQKEGMYPNWSPDGEKIIYSGRRNGIWEIMMVSSEGGEEELISNNQKEGKTPGWGAVCSFHPNGKSIVYSHIREKVMYSLNLETKERKRLSPVGESYMHPMYSKDGLRIAVNRKKEAGYNLITISPEGKDEEIIAKNVISYSSPSWSDSNKELLFTGMVNDNQEIFKINLETRQETQLTNNADFDAMPTWK